MASKAKAPEVTEPVYLAVAGGWGLTPSGVWVALGEDGADPQPPTVADVQADAPASAKF